MGTWYSNGFKSQRAAALRDDAEGRDPAERDRWNGHRDARERDAELLMT